MNFLRAIEKYGIGTSTFSKNIAKLARMQNWTIEIQWSDIFWAAVGTEPMQSIIIRGQVVTGPTNFENTPTSPVQAINGMTRTATNKDPWI